MTSRTIHIEGLDLAGKSTICRKLVEKLGARKRHNSLVDPNPVQVRAVNPFPAVFARVPKRSVFMRSTTRRSLRQNWTALSPICQQRGLTSSSSILMKKIVTQREMHMDVKLLYSAVDNLWLRDDDGTISVGVASSMLAVLGKPEFVNLPAVGAEIMPSVPFGSLENSKSAFDLTLPFPCEVISTGSDVEMSALVAASDGELPLLTVRTHTAQWSDGLLDAAGYADFIAP